MVGRFSAGALLALAAIAGPAGARTAIAFDDARLDSGADSLRLPGYLQCVPYARAVSGIQIFGDARTWWDQAEGRYARGRTPRVGAVMAFRPYGNMRLGHVAAVSDIVDSRTVLLRHANWSPINGRRGQIEDDVRAIDVSPNNDWSQVRVWYAPIRSLGGTAWPVAGFIYNQKPGGGDPRRLAEAPVQLVRAEPYKQLPDAPTVQLLAFKAPVSALIVRAVPYKALPTATPSRESEPRAAQSASARPGRPTRTDSRMALGSDPIGEILARRNR